MSRTSPVSGPEKLLEELERATYVTLHGVNWTLGLGNAEQRTLIDALRKSSLAQCLDLVPVAYRVKFKGDSSWTLYYSDPRKHPDDVERLGLVAVEPLFTSPDTSRGET